MKGIFTAIIVIFNFLIMDAQSKLDNAITNLEENYSQEKVYILFDKDQYVAGDQMLFQSFVFDGYNLSSISKTLYVELYDQSKKIIDKRTILINNGKASGLFELNKTLTEDVYFVRAYTNWMANFDTEWNFIKPIPIYNLTSKKKLVPSVTSKWSVVAFPEGGTFIDKTTTTIAVRINHQGKPAKKWSGYLIDSELPDNKIVSFQSLDENIAIFQMTPQFGKTYKVVVEDGEGNSQTITLPAVVDRGIQLKVDSDKSEVKYTINAISLDKNAYNYSIVGTIDNQLAYKANIKSTNSQVSGIIPLKNIGQSGIMQISIFDDRDNLVANRLCFINQNKMDDKSIVIKNSNFNNIPRASNSFDINDASNDNQFTVLIKDVTDKDSQQQDNILSNIYLTQDLKNPINNPAQYFSKNADPKALDALLISEKWKRFDWAKVINGQKPLIKYNLLDNEFVSYKARLALNSRPLPNTLVNLVFKNNDGESMLSQFTTDQNGDLFITNLNSENPYSVNYFLNSKEEVQPNLTLKLKPLIEITISKLNFPPTGFQLTDVNDNFKLPSSVEKAFANAEIREKIIQDETLIEEVKLTKTKRDTMKKLNNELASGVFASLNATIFDLVNDNQDAMTSINILEWLKGRVAGLSIRMIEPGTYMAIMRGVEVRLYLDEVVATTDAILMLNTNLIAMVKVFRDSSLGGNSILIYTRKANMKFSNTADLNNKFEIKAYDKIITGKMIDYSQEKYRSSISDWRQVLYWNPEFTNSTVNFYNNDNAKNREITIIGFDKENKLLYNNQTIE